MSRSKAAKIIIILFLFAYLSLMLKIQPVEAAGTVYIRPDGNVDPPGTPIQKNGDTYTFTDDISASIIVQKSNIIIDGAGHLLQGSIFDNGIDLSSLTEVTVKNVTINNFDYGVYIASSNHITISGNTIVNNNGGIWLKESTNNLVSNNLIRNNFLDGIYIWSSSNNNISQNNVESNVYGITDYYGSSNRIYHNNIVNNDYSANPNEPADIWDNGYPSGGNYWSDYTGVDKKCGPSQDHPGGDGIGDTPYTIDSNNKDNYPLMNPWTPPSGHNVAVISVVPSKTVVGQGYSCSITVYGANRGEYSEDFNVTVYANTTSVASQNVALSRGTFTTLTFAWSTSGFAYGNYTISAYAWPVPGETDTADNSFPDGWVFVTIPGDVNSDLKVNILDCILLANHFGHTGGNGHALGSKEWRDCMNCDINGDFKVNILDAIVLADHFGEANP